MTSPSDPTRADPQSEDCLSLNVWTPELPDEAHQRPGRPVMVWIHGGGFTTGSGSVFFYRGGNLCAAAMSSWSRSTTVWARSGSLAIPVWKIGTGAIGNWGLHDQVAALRWVHEHIARVRRRPDQRHHLR